MIRGDFAAADIAYKSMTESWPNIAFAHSRRGRALLQLGDRPEATREFEHALQLDPNEPEALYSMGLIAQELGRETDAFQRFERAFAATRPHPEAGLKLADASLSRGSPSTALDLYQRVLEIDPNIAEAHYGLAICATLLGNEEQAIEAFRHALFVKPDFAAAKAVAIFQQLFPIPSARRPRPVRPLICIPVVVPYYRNWLGGQSYLINFARIMSTLPKAQRPRIVVVSVSDDQHDVDGLRHVFQPLAQNDAVIGVINSRGEQIFSKPVLDRIFRRVYETHRRTQNATQQLMSDIDWTFPILYPQWPVPAIPGPLFWIPDLQHRFWPSFFDTSEIAGRDRDMSALALRAVPVVLSSGTAQQHFQHHFPKQQCRSYVWHFASQPDMAGAQVSECNPALQLPERFYYTPNQFWRHKDHVTLFRALRRILDSGSNVTFVCTGSDLGANADSYSLELLELIQSLSLGSNLRLLGILPRADQIEVMRHCCAVIQPSLFEGWSTVIEDARAIGRPIIASDIPVHREQLGDQACFFTPGSAKSLADAVIALEPKLKPGPSPEDEAAALVDLKSRMQKSARDFLEILKHEVVLRT